MCLTCGCSDSAETRLTDLGKPGTEAPHEHTHINPDGTTVTHSHAEAHSHSHDHEHMHSHDHEHSHSHDHDHSDDHGPAHSHDHEHSHSHDHEHAHSHDSDHSHSHDHGHAHSHDPEHAHLSANEPTESSFRADQNRPRSVIAIETDVLNKNNELANNNRTWLHSRGIVALNLLSSPGAGKTTLLECSIRALKDQVKISVLEGDQETTNDAARIRSAGAPVIQINTGAGCHLEANMVALGIEKLSPENNSLLFIENVGNLVCPALFDLGEERKIVILSVTEGEDKPLKYPHIFRAAELMILNKIDLLPHLDFDVEECVKNALAVNPKLRLFKLSAKSGEGMPEWLEFLKQLVYSASVVTPRSPR